MTATQELVVPRSIPMTLPMMFNTPEYSKLGCTWGREPPFKRFRRMNSPFSARLRRPVLVVGGHDDPRGPQQAAVQGVALLIIPSARSPARHPATAASSSLRAWSGIERLAQRVDFLDAEALHDRPSAVSAWPPCPGAGFRRRRPRPPPGPSRGCPGRRAARWREAFQRELARVFDVPCGPLADVFELRSRPQVFIPVLVRPWPEASASRASTSIPGLLAPSFPRITARHRYRRLVNRLHRPPRDDRTVRSSSVLLRKNQAAGRGGTPSRTGGSKMGEFWGSARKYQGFRGFFCGSSFGFMRETRAGAP